MAIVKYMKYSYVLFLVFFTLQACGQTDSKQEEINFLTQFYKGYVENWENPEESELIKKNHLTDFLFTKIKALNASGELGFDPLLNAQDISDDLNNRLNIIYNEESKFYEACYFNTFNKTNKCVYLKLIKHKGKFLINDIKVNEIKSILNYQEKNVNPIQQVDNSSKDFEIKILNQDIIIVNNGKEKKYKNIFINKMSISSSLEEEADKEFSLIYEMNASSTKMKERYKFQFIKNELFLVFKETVKYGQEGLAAKRIYFESYNMMGRTYEDIINLGSKLNEIFKLESPDIYLYDYTSSEFAKISNSSYIEDYFVEYPETKKEEFQISNIEAANNLAFDLEQKGIYNESIIILNQIIDQFPNRVVAYLNLADAYWGLDKKEDAKKNYKKYISLMKSQGKDLKKIPQRVYERIE